MVTRPTGAAPGLRAVLDHLPDALLVVDSDGAIIDANAPAARMFAAPTAAAVRGHKLLDLLPDLDVEPVAPPSPFDSRDERGPAVVRRGHARTLDGTGFAVEVSRSTMAWDAGGDVELVCLRPASGADPRVELYRARAETQSVLRATEEGVCGVDPTGRIVLANPAAARLLGGRVADVADRRLHDLAMHTRADGTPHPPEDSPVTDTLRTGRRHRRRPAVLWRLDGSPFPATMSTAAVKDGQEVLGAVATFTDASTLVEQVRRSDRLVRLLRTQVQPGLVALQRRAGPAADPALERLIAAVGEAVGYERLMSGEAMSAEPSAVEVAEIVDAAVAATTEAPARGVTVEVTCEPGRVVGDRGWLVAAVSELARAVVRAAPRGGAVAVTATRRDGQVSCTFAATGPGGNPENPLLRRLRVGGSAEAGEPDLAMVQTVADRHRGTVVIDRQVDAAGVPGPWSYTLRLPAADQPAAEQAPADSQAGATAGPPAATADPPAGAATTRSVPPRTAGESPGSTRATSVVLVWPQVHQGTAFALRRRGWSPAPLEVGTGGSAAAGAVVLVDPLAGPVRKRQLAEVRAVASAAARPLLVLAGLGEVGPGEPGAGGPAALLGALHAPGEAAARVLVVEEDPAVAAALAAGLQRSGMNPRHADSQREAIRRAVATAPDLLLLRLSVTSASTPGIVDWLRTGGLLGRTPIVAYTIGELRGDYRARLRRGETTMTVQARDEDPRVDEDLAELLGRITGGLPMPGS